MSPTREREVHLIELKERERERERQAPERDSCLAQTPSRLCLSWAVNWEFEGDRDGWVWRIVPDREINLTLCFISLSVSQPPSIAITSHSPSLSPDSCKVQGGAVGSRHREKQVAQCVCVCVCGED